MSSSLAQNIALLISRQRWLPYRWRRSVMKRLTPKLIKGYEFTTTMSGGMKFSGNIVNYIDRIIYFCGLHEKYMLFFIRDLLSKLKDKKNIEINFIDIGANAGNHSVYLSPLLDHVYSFEPWGRVREQLVRNIELNDIKNITVFDVGLGNENKKLPFYSGPEDNLGSASFVDGHRGENKPLGELSVRIGDEVAKESNLRPISLLKADIEGFEPEAIKGLAQTIKKDRPIIIVELSPTTKKTWSSKEKLAADLPENYQFYAFAKGSNDSGKYLIEPYDDSKNYKIEDVICVPDELASIMH